MILKRMVVLVVVKNCLPAKASVGQQNVEEHQKLEYHMAPAGVRAYQNHGRTFSRSLTKPGEEFGEPTTPYSQENGGGLVFCLRFCLFERQKIGRGPGKTP